MLKKPANIFRIKNAIWKFFNNHASDVLYVWLIALLFENQVSSDNNFVPIRSFHLLPPNVDSNACFMLLMMQKREKNCSWLLMTVSLSSLSALFRLKVGVETTLNYNQVIHWFYPSYLTHVMALSWHLFLRDSCWN